MKTLSYFIQGKFYGTSQVFHEYTPHNLAYFCPTCGDIWARVISDKCPYWQVEIVACEKHIPEGIMEWGRIPGALTLPIMFQQKYLAVPFWGRAIEQFPEEVLKREFFILLNKFERESIL